MWIPLNKGHGKIFLQVALQKILAQKLLACWKLQTVASTRIQPALCQVWAGLIRRVIWTGHWQRNPLGMVWMSMKMILLNLAVNTRGGTKVLRYGFFFRSNESQYVQMVYIDVIINSFQWFNSVICVALQFMIDLCCVAICDRFVLCCNLWSICVVFPYVQHKSITNR